MTNSVDPDQIAPSGSTLFAYAFLSETMVYKISEYLTYHMYTDTILIIYGKCPKLFVLFFFT